MNNEQCWQPVARVVFKVTSGIEPRIKTGSQENKLNVCVNARLLMLGPGRHVSLDLVESFDVLTCKCHDCGKDLEIEAQGWWEIYPQYCRACLAKIQEASDAKLKEDHAKAYRDARRRNQLLGAMDAADRELFVKVLPTWALREEREEDS